MKFKNLNKCGERKPKTKGAFGSIKHIGNYETLKVLRKSDRPEQNCNANGVANVNMLKVEVKENV